jgi:DNA (cytosine-5)-methyltransferase 1
MLRHVDLCSGIGGFSLGFEWAGLSQPVLFCDTEQWCRQVLKKHWPDVPIEKDVKELANDPTRIPDCDIITAGYPCQPFSQAGQRKGEADDRHIWPYIREIVALKRPLWCVFENVHGHIALGLDKVLADLEAEGYASRAFVLPACGVDANHRRDRVFIIAAIVGDPDCSEQQRNLQTAIQRWWEQRLEAGREAVADPTGTGGETRRTDRMGDEDRSSGDKVQPESPSSEINVADTDQQRPQGWLPGRSDQERQSVDGYAGRSRPIHQQPREDWWVTEPAVGRVAHGIPKRVDRLRGLGNAIVPQIAMRIGLTIKQTIENELETK